MGFAVFPKPLCVWASFSAPLSKSAQIGGSLDFFFFYMANTTTSSIHIYRSTLKIKKSASTKINAEDQEVHIYRSTLKIKKSTRHHFISKDLRSPINEGYVMPPLAPTIVRSNFGHSHTHTQRTHKYTRSTHTKRKI